jgi:hypothetical protein
MFWIDTALLNTRRANHLPHLILSIFWNDITLLSKPKNDQIYLLYVIFLSDSTQGMS